MFHDKHSEDSEVLSVNLNLDFLKYYLDRHMGSSVYYFLSVTYLMKMIHVVSNMWTRRPAWVSRLKLGTDIGRNTSIPCQHYKHEHGESSHV